MHRSFVSCFSALLFFISSGAMANDSVSAELQGYGAFSNLNKDWMLMALYQVSSEEAKDVKKNQRLEVRVATNKLSARRFRQLWLEALAVEHGTHKIARRQTELDHFFNMIQAPLIRGDILVLERSAQGTTVDIDYHRLGLFSHDFIDLLVQSLTGKHPPTQALKTGLTGSASLREQVELSIRFERLEPTLPRIATLSRWRKSDLATVE